jgi:hypothetical protein
MRKTLPALAAAAAIALMTVAVPGDANARCRGCVAGAVVGGIAAGALIGSALANPYGPPGPVYVAPGPAYVAEPVCHVRRERWWDGYMWRVRSVRVCDDY